MFISRFSLVISVCMFSTNAWQTFAFLLAFLVYSPRLARLVVWDKRWKWVHNTEANEQSAS